MQGPGHSKACSEHRQQCEEAGSNLMQETINQQHQKQSCSEVRDFFHESLGLGQKSRQGQLGASEGEGRDLSQEPPLLARHCAEHLLS